MKRIIRVDDKFPFTINFSEVKTIETDTCIMTVDHDDIYKLGECVVDVKFK